MTKKGGRNSCNQTGRAYGVKCSITRWQWYEVPKSYRNGRTIACLVVPIKNLQIEEDITDLKQQKTQQAECVTETCWGKSDLILIVLLTCDIFGNKEAPEWGCRDCVLYLRMQQVREEKVLFHLTKGRLSVTKVSLLLENCKKKCQNQLNDTC